MKTFGFTDIVGSTALWEEYGDVMGYALAEHDAILHDEVSKAGGYVIKHTGDGIFAVFSGGDPLCFALNVQKRFERRHWGVIGKLQLRIALHAGQVQERNGDYFGAAVNRAARLLCLSQGGQILLTPDVVRLAPLPARATLHDLGTHKLKDLTKLQRIYELQHPDLSVQPVLPITAMASRLSNVRWRGHQRELLVQSHLSA